MKVVGALSCAIVAALALACSAKEPLVRNGNVNGTGGSGGMAGSPTESPETVRARCDSSLVGAPQLRRLTRGELETTIKDVFPELGSGWFGVKLGLDPVSRLGFTNDASVNVVGAQTAKELQATAEDVASRISEQLTTILACSTTSADAACAAQFIDRYGARLFRRPLTAEEQQRYASYHASVLGRSNFTTATKWTLVALLQSPHTVYRSEIGSPAADERQLSEYEIASQLSYTFGGTPPSAELLAMAQRGELLTASVRVAQARKLLATPNGQEALRQFFREWVGYPKVEGKTKDALANEFSVLKRDMVEETRRFIDEVVLRRGGGVADLLTAPFTIINGPLATFYGYGTPTGDFTLVNRPANNSIGLLAQGSILAAYAHGDSSSPTLRGLLVYERLFCNERQPPPSNVIPQVEAPQPGVKTTRQRYEETHVGTAATCRNCHEKSDPPGFAFEHFDEAGRYRANEAGLPIDTAATMVDAAGAEIMTFDGLTDLVSQAAQKPEVTDCVSGLVAAYAFGGAGRCLAEEQRDALQSGKYGLADYFAELAGAPNFTRRAAP